MRFARDLRALLKRNWLIKKRHACLSCCEIFLPVFFTAVFCLLYLAFDDQNEPTKQFPALRQEVVPLAVLPQRMKRINHLIAVLPADGSNNLQSARDEVVRMMSEWYPGINASDFSTEPLATAAPMVGFADVLRTFDSTSDLESYVKNDDYLRTNSRPGIWAAITINKWNDGGEFDYSIRMNVTEVPESIEPVDRLQRDLTFEWQNRYIRPPKQEGQYGAELWDDPDDNLPYPGFTSFQLMMDRIIAFNASGGATKLNESVFSTTQLDATFQSSLSLLRAGLDIGTAFSTEISARQTAGTLEAFYNTLRKAFQAELYTPNKAGVTPFPVTAYTSNGFYGAAKDAFALFFIISFMMPVALISRAIVKEKEERIREGMRMMGLPLAALTVSWYITYIVVFLIVSLLAAFLCAITLFPQSGFVYIWLTFFVFGVSTIAFGYMISVFFSRSKLAAVMSALLYFAAFFPYFAVSASTEKYSNKVAASILSPTAFGLALDVMARYENDRIGITTTTADDKIENFVWATAMWMMLLDFIIYTIIGWYFEKVLPSEYGVPRKPWFFVQPSYWREQCGKDGEHDGDQHHVTPQKNGGEDQSGNSGADSELLQAPDGTLRAKAADNKCVAVKRLRKEFSTPDGIKVAVDDIDMTMYEGQVFVLLGHNGAGKTTTMNMLTGMIPATSGDAAVYGKNVFGEMTAIRREMGVCPQHDVLFPELTVKEHLELYASIKEVSEDKVEKEIRKIVADIGLTEKLNVASGNLSGGQKRKLSVAIAMIGGSKVLFLDEPTSGMDPYSRRSTWEVIQNAREGRIIILTTHMMDEADLLGDRICIMSKGKVRCCGTPMFLKSKFGVGYNMTVVKDTRCNVPAIKEIVRRRIENSTMLSDVGTELSFQLPLSASSEFPALFAELDEHEEDYGIATYGISVTTMEEVFLKVADEEAKSMAEVHQRQPSRDDRLNGSPRGSGEAPINVQPSKHAADEGAAETGGAATIHDVRREARTAQKGIFFKHFVALFKRKYHFTKRDRRSVCFMLLIPVLALLGGLLLLKAGEFGDWPSYQVTTYDFNVPPDGDGPSKPNFVPSFNHFFDVNATAANPDVTALLGKLASPNATTVAVTPSDVNSLQINDPYGFIAEVAGRGETAAAIAEMSSYLVQSKPSLAASRYGAYMLPETSEFNSAAAFEYEVMQNSTARHATPIFINLMNSAYLRNVTGQDNLLITTRNHPMPWTTRQSAVISGFFSFSAAQMIVIAFAFIPASYAIFIVKEREVNAKHQQLISGVSIPAYWLSTYAWDFASYLIPGTLAVVLIVIFDIGEFIDGEALAATILLFLFYGMATATFTYMLTYGFKSHSTALIVILIINIGCVILMLASFIMSLIDSTCSADRALSYIYRFLPGYSLGNGLVRLATIALLPDIEARCGGDSASKTFTPLRLTVAGTNILYLALTSVLYLLITIMIDVGLSHPSIRGKIQKDPDVPPREGHEDDDVLEEGERIKRGEADAEAIVLKQLRKTYPGHPPKQAVRELSYAVPVGECFGFLGINGAGKTTTLKMLSGDLLPTSGGATLAGYDILTQQPEVRRLLGYCPQFDALLELLTAREHLELFARIKGVSESDLAGVVDAKLQEMDLLDFENKLAGTLSGGNKRKLSVGIAMIGNPPIVFLDEPSTGMDPKARRFMWDVIARMSTERKACSIILTTHSMEECEALCSRVGIMVGGQLRCLGSIQHIKHKYGDGYMSEVRLHEVQSEKLEEFMTQAKNACVQSERVSRQQVEMLCEQLGLPHLKQQIAPRGGGWIVDAGLRRSADDSIPLRDFCSWFADEAQALNVLAFYQQTAFPGATLVERHGLHMRFRIPRQEGVTLGQMFERMEQEKERLNIQEYSLSQTSLEQVFNQFAAQQDEEKGVARGMEYSHGQPQPQQQQQQQQQQQKQQQPAHSDNPPQAL